MSVPTKKSYFFATKATTFDFKVVRNIFSNSPFYELTHFTIFTIFIHSVCVEILLNAFDFALPTKLHSSFRSEFLRTCYPEIIRKIIGLVNYAFLDSFFNFYEKHVRVLGVENISWFKAS